MGKAELTKSVVLAVFRGQESDPEVIVTACDVAKRKSARLRGLFVLEVPRSLPLGTWDEEGEARARSVLDAARGVSEQAGCSLEGRVRPARHVGQAIVDEAVELSALSIVMSRPHPTREGDAASYVMDKAVCGVLVLQASKDVSASLHRSTSGGGGIGNAGSRNR